MRNENTTHQSIDLSTVGNIKVKTDHPFNFRYTLWKPSHFPTLLEKHFSNASYRTFRLKNGLPVGTKIKPLSDGSPGIDVKIFAQRSLSEAEKSELEYRLRVAYGLDFQIEQFYQAVANDNKLTQGPITFLHGMRPSCPESLFEIIVVSIVLQNTTVKRSQSMLMALLEAFGDLVNFEDQELYVFCDVNKVAASSEGELREHCRLGYRAKYLQPIAEAFVQNIITEDELLRLSEEEALVVLMKLKGIGPYSAHTVLSARMQNPNLINLDVWNRKILSQFLFDKLDASKEEILESAQARWGQYKGLATLYLIESEYKDKPTNPLIIT